MSHIQKNLISIASSALVGGMASYYTTGSFHSGFSTSFLNGAVACTLNETLNKKSEGYKRAALTAGAIALTCLFKSMIAPRLFKRAQPLSARDLLPPLLLSAAIGSLPFLNSSKPPPNPEIDLKAEGNQSNQTAHQPPKSPKSKHKEQAGKPAAQASPFLPREKPKGYPLDGAPHWHKSSQRTENTLSPEVRMQRNLEKAISEHRALNAKAPYATMEMLTGSNPPVATLAFVHGSDEIQGLRGNMEDEHFYQENDVSILTGVFDGHGGQGAATHAKTETPKLFFEILKEQQGNIVKTFEVLCQRVHDSYEDQFTGTTAVICYIDKSTGTVYTATVADAEANVYREIDGSLRSIPLSPIRDWNTDDKYLDEAKYTITDKGLGDKPRLDGINISRAIGDKHHLPISQKPKVTHFRMLPGDTLILCCDGLKDFASEATICETVTEHRDSSEKDLAQALTQVSCKNQNSWYNDNVSVIVVRAKG